MLDQRLLREDPNLLAHELEKRGVKSDLASLQVIARKHRDLEEERSNLQREGNQIGKEVGEKIKSGEDPKSKLINDLRDKGNTWFIPYETINSKELRGKHPATFPVKLAEDCIKLTGIDCGVVLDPFMGTGSTGLAANNLGWSYIGYEIDEDYVKFAENRINGGLTSILK